MSSEEEIDSQIIEVDKELRTALEKWKKDMKLENYKAYETASITRRALLLEKAKIKNKARELANQESKGEKTKFTNTTNRGPITPDESGKHKFSSVDEWAKYMREGGQEAINPPQELVNIKETGIQAGPKVSLPKKSFVASIFNIFKKRTNKYDHEPRFTQEAVIKGIKYPMGELNKDNIEKKVNELKGSVKNCGFSGLINDELIKLAKMGVEAPASNLMNGLLTELNSLNNETNDAYTRVLLYLLESIIGSSILIINELNNFKAVSEDVNKIINEVIKSLSSIMLAASKRDNKGSESSNNDELWKTLKTESEDLEKKDFTGLREAIKNDKNEELKSVIKGIESLEKDVKLMSEYLSG